jgi:drug/metabolite transporter (DMT)-like permease
VTTSHGERVAVTAFVTYTVLAGGNAVGIRFSNRELAPLWGASLRFALAAGLFLAVMVVLRLAFPRGRPLLGSLLYGLLNIGAAFGLIYYGLGYMPDSAKSCWRLCHWPLSCSQCSGGRSTSPSRQS